MTSIDDLFKKPGLPNSSTGKRKLEANNHRYEVYKSAKLSLNGDAKGKEHVENVDDGDNNVEGPELPPEEDSDQVEDEEGRFFGGGVTKDTAEVLDYLDERDGEVAAPEKVDAAWLRRLALNFERRISKNAELRVKFEDDPQKFMGSEADLDAEIKGLSVLTDHSQLYPEFCKLGCVNSLVSLVAHENTDIAIGAIEVLAELTDEDVEVEQTHWNELVGAMLEADLPNLLVQNFDRLDESNEADRSGVYHSLSLLENLGSQSSVSEKLVENSSILRWLIARIELKESPIGQNKQYSAEVLAILLQSSDAVRSNAINLGAVDLFLQLLSAYRKRDPPKDTEEEEFAENIFDCLTCLVESMAGKTKFLDGEGVELCLIMLRESKFSKPRALRLLDHAMAGSNNSEQVCEQLVEAAGLKTVFGMFMKTSDRQTIEHVLGIFASLLRSLPGASAARIRALAKFMEKDYEKLGKLVQLRREYRARLLPADLQISHERAALPSDSDADAMAYEWLSRRLDAGLYICQTVDIILAWLIAEDSGARSRVVALLHERKERVEDIKATLEEQLGGLQEDETEDADMLRTLIECVG